MVCYPIWIVCIAPRREKLCVRKRGRTCQGNIECSAISIVLTYFAVKFVFNKKDEEAIKTFVLVEVIYIVVAFILSFIGIYI